MGLCGTKVNPNQGGEPQEKSVESSTDKGASSPNASPKASSPPVPTVPGFGEIEVLTEEDARAEKAEEQHKFKEDFAMKRRISRNVHTLQENMVVHDVDHDIRQFYELDNDVFRDESKVLGKGMAGQVRRITRKEDGKEFALKTIKLSKLTESKKAILIQEITMLRGLDHPHIAKLYETYVEEGMAIHMVLEICEGGELFDRLMKRGKLKEGYASNIVKQMLSTMRYLHSVGVVHRDLKLENWLFRAKESAGLFKKGDQEADQIVLIDFGLSHKFESPEEEEHLHGKVGTNYYIAPEVLAGDYSSSCDMWSLGVVTYMILSGRAPFTGWTDRMILNSVKTGKYEFPDSAWEKISEDAKDFVRKLMEVDTEKRMTAEQAMNHPWITKEAMKHSQQEMDASMFENIRKFRKFHELKRVAISAVAFSLQHDEIKELEKVFEDMSLGGDGFVTFEELKAALHKRGLQDDNEIKQIFEAIDEEQSGRIHVTEFVAATLQAKYHQDEEYLARAFHKLDPTSTGFITLESLRGLLGKCTTDERAKTLLTEAQISHHKEEDKISYKQFLKFMRTDGEDDISQHRRSSQAMLAMKMKKKSVGEEVKDKMHRSFKQIFKRGSFSVGGGDVRIE